MGTKPVSGTYSAHKADSGPIDCGQELSWSDFKQILTENRNYANPRTVARGTAADILTNFSARLIQEF